MSGKLSKSFFVGALVSVFSLGAVAANEDGSGMHAGLKAVNVDIDLPGSSADIGFGLNLGYSFNANSAIELEYISGSGSATELGVDVDLDVTSTSLYWAYRSSGPWYFLGKLGLSMVDGKASVGGFSSSASETGLGLSVGGGYRFSDSFAVELDYNKVESDTTFIGLMGRINF